MPGKRSRKGKKSEKDVKCQRQEPETSPPPSPQLPTDTPQEVQPPLTNAPTSPVHPLKKTKVMTDLTVDQEEDMASWLEENELFYNKKLTIYKDFKKKDMLWDSKAVSIGKDVQMLKVWYRSIRTRFTRLMHRKSGEGASELTERDQWILGNFDWLKRHVVEVPKKTTVSMKEKIGSVSSFDDAIDDVFDDPIPTETPSTSKRLEPLPQRSLRSTSQLSKKAEQEEEEILRNIAAREEQSIAFQTKVLDMMAPPKATERTRYGDWAKEVMVNIHPSLWVKFQRECSNLLYAYKEKSEEANTLTQTQKSQQQFQYQLQPMVASGTSSPNIVWQPPPHQWPTTVQQNMSVWGSQNSAWVQGQMQPIATVIRGPSPTSLTVKPTTSAATKLSEPALNLSKIINDTIGMPDTSPESTLPTMKE